MSKKVLVTGGAGYIGSHAAKCLAQAGYEPIVLDNLSRGHREAVRWGPLIEGDLGDRILLRDSLRRFDIGAVMHFAALAYVGESMTTPELYFANNVVNSLNLLEAMREAGVQRIVFSSTCATYGIPQAVPIREEMPQRPINPYGESKLMVERMLHWYGTAHGLAHMALRYFNAAGSDPEGEIGEHHEPETHLIPLVLDAALGRRRHVEIYGIDYPTPDGTAIRDYIHVTDLATAHVLALKHLEEGGASGALNLATGRGHSVREVIAVAERVAKRSIPCRESERRPGDPPALVADASRAKTLLAWNPTHSDIETIVTTAWRWHRERFAAPQPAG